MYMPLANPSHHLSRQKLQTIQDVKYIAVYFGISFVQHAGVASMGLPVSIPYLKNLALLACICKSVA
eukprot:scaffold135092_cov19-Tisochrysis_lutea.AAC.1